MRCIHKAHVATGLVALAAIANAQVPSRDPEGKYSLKVPGGLAFSEFNGYEHWETISISQNARFIAVILGNKTMIDAYKAGFPGNGKQVPDGARMAKIHWEPRRNDAAPGQPLVPGTLHDVDFMVKDAKRFADSGGWGYAVFLFDEKSGEFRPGTLTDARQGNDAKCGFACHTVVKDRDYVFTDYAGR